MAVADAGSLSRAAIDLHVAQPALSYEIKRVEQELGLRLFDRLPKGVALTGAGLRVYEQARRALSEYEALDELAGSLRRHEGLELRVGFLGQGPGELLPQAIRAFKQRYPAVKVILQQFGFNDCFLGVSRNLTDVSFNTGMLDEDDRVATARLFEEGLMVAMAADHPLAARECVHIAEILEEPLISDTHPAGRWRDYWDAIDHRNGQMPRIVARCESHDEFLEGVRVGAGIAICPQSTPRYYRRPGLVFVPLIGMAPLAHSVIWRQSDTNQLVHDFVQIARRIGADRNRHDAGAETTAA